MNKFKHFIIKEPVFDSCVDVFVNCKLEKVKKIVKENRPEVDMSELNDSNAGYCLTFQLNKNKVIRILWVKTFNRSINSLGTLAHETFHLIGQILEDKNIRLSQSSDEVYAYLYEFYFKEMLMILRKPDTIKENVKHKKRKRKGC